MALLQSDPCARRTPVAADIWSLLRPPARSPTEYSRSSCSGSPLTAACPAPSERTPSRGGPAPSLNAKFRSTSRPSSRPSCSPSAPPGNSWPDGWFRPMWRDRRPVPVEEANQSIVNSCQLRADHWSESEECLRIGRLSSPDCTQCSSDEYPTALCQHYREKAGIPKHVLLRCPRRWRDAAPNARAAPFTQVHNCIIDYCIPGLDTKFSGPT